MIFIRKPNRSERHIGGFSFLELFIGIVILMAGVIPIFWVLSGSNKGAKLTVQQVEATNHASNLLEAIRAVGFDAVSQFPAVMVQPDGGGGIWRYPEDAASLGLAGVGQQPPAEDQKKAFESFRLAFFDGKDPIVPPMEDNFRRYLIVQGSKSSAPSGEGMEEPGAGQPAAQAAGGGMIGVTVRVEWSNNVKGKPEEKVPQYVELKTVLGDPYRFLGGGK